MDIALVGLVATIVAFRIIGMTTGREGAKPLDRNRFLIHLGILGLLLCYCIGSRAFPRSSTSREDRLAAMKTETEALLAEGRAAEASAKAAESLAEARKKYGAEDPKTLPYLHLHVKCLGREKKGAEAEAASQRALEIALKAYDKDSPEVALEENNLGALYADLGRLDRAEALYRSALSKVERVLGVVPPVLPVVLENLADLCEKSGRSDEARQYRDRAHGIRGRRAGNP